ncbi:sentrin-specific protease 7 [Clarias gariepinus]|uniref:sentrin-specific protease 7 n=1 Tax=Clarias gariepinus TaxID=13013 RepID=UPI00234D73D0|nr:sentrin-specific protease 7 [Clarias gariepinus]XP_053366357.1 sentrin-specific protease 7 [Clarias gariepinus]
MQQILGRSNIFALSINHCSPPSQGVVLKKRHFQYALSGRSQRISSNDEVQDPKINESALSNKMNQAGKPKSCTSDELSPCMDKQPLHIPRKFRMRDQYGYLLPKKHTARASASASYLPSSHVEGFNKLTLNVKSLKLGTLDFIFRGPVTFSVDYIEITNKVWIQALNLTSCEWCKGHEVAALVLQMNDPALWHLREQLAMSTDMGMSDQSKNQQEKYLIIIFESAPTVLEEATLEEIFTEIGRLRNFSNFFVKLACEEATSRLMGYNCSHKELYSVAFSPTNVQSGITTLSVSDSEDDDLIKGSSSHTQSAKILVIYPPPPAKGGFSITEEDLGCLDEGQFLNDVIIDFYLKYLVCKKLKEEDSKRCHVFSSFFYNSLTQDDLKEDSDSTDLSIQERRHNRVKTWTRHFDIFKKDFIFVPINQSAHWYLAVICFPGQASCCSIMDICKNKNEENSFTPSSPFSNPMSLFYRHQTSEQVSNWSTDEGEMDEGFYFLSDNEIQHDGTSKYASKISDTTAKRPCILIMDSLSCGDKPTVVKVLQEYLEMEWRVRKGSVWSFGKRAMKGWRVQVPQQDNHTDCGVYVLQYVESFITNPPKKFHSSMDLRDWFSQRLVKKKREKIKRLIYRLHQQQAEVGV